MPSPIYSNLLTLKFSSSLKVLNFGNFCILVVYIFFSFAVLFSGRKNFSSRIGFEVNSFRSWIKPRQGHFCFLEFLSFWRDFEQFDNFLRFKNDLRKARSFKIVAAINDKIATVQITRWNYLHIYWPVWQRPRPGPVRLRETVRMVELVLILVVSVSFQLVKIQHQSVHGSMVHSVLAANCCKKAVTIK